MAIGGATPVGSSRALRLDPLALPVRFTAKDAGADERLRHVELDRSGVVVRRAVAGIRMAVNLPLATFLGVTLRLTAGNAGAADIVTLTLEHRDPTLSVTLYSAPDNDTVVDEWQLWGRVLRQPLLVADSDGTLHEPFKTAGGLRLGQPSPRRRRRNAVQARRSRMALRRPVLAPFKSGHIHRGEREIIARH